MARFWRKNNLTKDTILKLALGGTFILVAATSPYFLNQSTKSYFKDKNKKAIYARARKIKQLNSRKIVSFKELENGEIRIEITHKGKLLLRQYKLDDIKILKPRVWDKRWRVIIYDIPHDKKVARDALRSKFGQFGFYPLQKSVWISAYECLSEIEFLCAVFEIDLDGYVHYFTALSIPREREIRKWFGL